jgi:hypothetical protein
MTRANSIDYLDSLSYGRKCSGCDDIIAADIKGIYCNECKRHIIIDARNMENEHKDWLKELRKIED